MDKVVEFKGRKTAAPANDDGDDQFEVLIRTIGNLLTAREQQDRQISTLIALMSEMQSRISDLEHKVSRLKKADDKKPVILNSHGSRAN